MGCCYSERYKELLCGRPTAPHMYRDIGFPVVVSPTGPQYDITSSDRLFDHRLFDIWS